MLGGRLLIIISQIQLGSALRMTSKYFENDDANKERKKVAYCVSGQARYFTDPALMKGFKEYLGFLNQEAEIDLFAHMTYLGDGPKHQRGWDFEAVNADKKDLVSALESLNCKNYQLEDVPARVTEENVGKFVSDKKCFQYGYWEDLSKMARQLNYFEHLRDCFKKITHYEKKHSIKYDVVIEARPDLMYSNCTLDFQQIASGQIYHTRHVDWFFAVPRKAIDNFFVAPLQCLPNRPCCGKISRTEDVVMYMFGDDAQHTTKNTCRAFKVKRSEGKTTKDFFF